MFEKVQAIIADQLGIDPAKITPQTHLINDLKADSLDVVALVMDLEQEYGIEIPDEELLEMQTVQSILDFIDKHEND
ncbi:MAG: acyl carrier protein [Christensenellaceae bacterium]|jgi:acyl carrier protein|nr:acyl carrier protein [Christensenellaceae bacterium]